MEHPGDLPDCTSEEKLQLKRLGERITKIAKTVQPSMYFRITSKEKVLSLLETRKQKGWLQWLMTPGKPWAGVMAAFVLFFVVIASVIPVGVPPEVGAKHIGELRANFGVVYVRRDGNIIPVHSGERLYIGDEVLVEDDAEAMVAFIDKTTGVIKENTDISIKKALINPEDAEDSHIELELRTGSFEARMDQKEPKKNSKLMVETPTSRVAAKKASFEVAVSAEGETEVVAFSDQVSVASKKSGENSEKLLVHKKEVSGNLTIAGEGKNELGNFEVMRMTSGPLTSSGTVIVEVFEDEDFSETFGTTELIVTSRSSVTEDNKDVQLETPEVFENTPAVVAVSTNAEPIKEKNSDPVEKTPANEVTENPFDITRMNSLRTQLQFAHIKLGQAQDAFSRGNEEEAFTLLFNYQIRLAEIHDEFFEDKDFQFSKENLDLENVLSERVSSSLIIHAREVKLTNETITIGKDVLSFLRRMIAQETTLRREIPLYLQKQKRDVVKEVALHTSARKAYPLIEDVITLQKEKELLSDEEALLLIPTIESRIQTLSNLVMKQDGQDSQKLFLEDMLSMIPNLSVHQYNVLRFKVYLPEYLHSIIDAKAALMN